jgi:hypothetical protein
LANAIDMVRIRCHTALGFTHVQGNRLLAALAKE